MTFSYRECGDKELNTARMISIYEARVVTLIGFQTLPTGSEILHATL